MKIRSRRSAHNAVEQLEYRENRLNESRTLLGDVN